MPVVRNTVDPLPPSDQRTVRVRLISPAGWRASGTVEVQTSWSTTINATTRVWELDLPSQSGYEVSGTFYRADEPGASWEFVVPDTVGPHWLRSLLVDPVPTATGWLLTPRMSQLADAPGLAGATHGQSPVWDSATQRWVPGSAGGGISDHGNLTGLADDDHALYLTNTRGDARYPPLARTLAAGTGLSGGGDLTANRSFAVAYGTTAGTALQGNDPAVTNPRPPTAHAASHASAGTDPVTPGAIGAASAGHNHPPAPVTLTDAVTVATDAAQGSLFRVAIGGDRTLGAPTNPTDGQRAIWEVTASGASRTLTLATGVGGFAFGTDVTALTTIGSGLTDYIMAIYRQSVDRWRVLAYSKGF